jgi:hypothetical protein
MAKKLLSELLRERTETIEYRKVRGQLMKYAQNEKTSYRIMKLKPDTIVQLQNEGITITEIDEPNYKVLELSW